MHEDTESRATNAPLARWWWPGQWLRIVYGVWIDQVWYWQNVRPKLRGRRQGWGIFVQTISGAVFAALYIVLSLGGVLSIAGVHLNWTASIAGVAFGVFLGVLMGVSSIITGILGFSWGIALGATWGVAAAIAIGLFSGLFWNSIENVNSTVLLATSAVVGVFLGIAQGIALGVITGTGYVIPFFKISDDTASKATKVIWNSAKFGCYFSFWIVSAAAFTVMQKEESSISLIASPLLIGFGAGLYFGERWATRQIPDLETRKRLANPDAIRQRLESSASPATR